MLWSLSLPPLTRSAVNRPASATAAVPWMSSLKVGNLVAVFVQQMERRVIGEVLELDQHARENCYARR